MRFLKFPLGLLRQPLTWAAFLAVWFLIRLLRKRSMKTRFRAIRWFIKFKFFWMRNKTNKNLALIRPDLDEKTIKKGVGQVTETAARSWAAMLGNGPDNLGQSKLEVRGMDPLLDYHRAGKKIVVVVGHVGPVDEAFAVFSHYNIRAYIPVEGVKPVWLFNLMTEHRRSFGDVVLEAVQKGETLKRARQNLSEGRIVVMTIDFQSRRGVKCQIGKGEASFPVGAVKLGLEEDAYIFPAFPSWGKNEEVIIEIGRPFKFPKTNDVAGDIERNTRWMIGAYGVKHIQPNWNQWLRAPYMDLEPVKDGN